MTDDPLSPAEQDLATLAASLGVTDAYLLHLLDLAEGGIPLSVGLFLNGMIVMGALVPGRAMAEEIDKLRAQLASFSSTPEDSTQEEWAKRMDEFVTAGSSMATEYEETIEALYEEAGDYTEEGRFIADQAPANLTRRMIDLSTRRFLTLADAQVVAPGQQGVTRIPVLRVAIAQVTAWWVIQFDEKGNASIQFWKPPE